MDCRGSVDSECESIGSVANVRGKVAEDQKHSNGNRDHEGAASPESGHSDQTTCESNPGIEALQLSDIHVREAMSGRTTSVTAGSKVKQRGDILLGTSGDTSSDYSSQVEEKTLPNSARGGSQSSAGGGQAFHEEDPPLPSISIRGNSPVEPAQVRNNGDGNNDESIPNITTENSAPVDNINGACTGGQKLPSNFLELAGRLSEPLGMAVATVFHEIFERRNGDFVTSAGSPVDELSELLGAALKESLFLVLGNDQRTTFVESFRNSFRSAYQTMRSVRRAFEASGGRLTSSTRHPYPNSRNGSLSKLRRVSRSQSYGEKARKNLEETSSVDTRKLPMTKNKAVAIRPVHNVESISEEEVTSFTPTRYGQQGQRVHSPCSSSGRTCLNESLQSTFFTNSTREPEGFSDTAGSCSKSCLNESLESSFFTSSNPELGGQQHRSPKSCSTNTINESIGSLLSEPTPDARGVHSEPLDTEDSWDVNMFSATSSPESDDWVMVDRDEVIASIRGQNESGCVITFDSWTSKKDQKHSRRVVEYGASPPPMRRVAGNSMEDTIPEGAFDSPAGRSVSGDLIQQTKHVGSSDSRGSCVVGDSMRDTKYVESSGGLGNHSKRSLQPDTSLRIFRDPLGTVHANSSLDHAGERLAKGMTSGASAEMGESSSVTGEPIMNLQQTSRRGEDLFGRHRIPEVGNRENVLVHRQLRGQVWGDTTQLTGPLMEDAALPPFFSYGLRESGQYLFERYVEAQEAQNHLKQLELAHTMKLLLVNKDHLQLQSESNSLMKENMDLSRSKIDLKEFELEDRKLTAAHIELSTMCADELVAGLFVMLLALAYSAWKFSYTRLSRVVTMCQLPPREPRPGGWLGTNWMANSIDAFTWRMHSLTCEVTKAGRMTAGLILIAFVASSLVRRSITSSSQTMPITMIVVVLGGICGLFGKISIDSLGGDGFLWLLLWELLCFLHAFATSCTPWLYKYLNGPSTKFHQSRSSFFLKLCSICARFSFHTFLVFALPVMAGLLPFASLDELNRAFWEFLESDTIIGPY